MVMVASPTAELIISFFTAMALMVLPENSNPSGVVYFVDEVVGVVVPSVV